MTINKFQGKTQEEAIEKAKEELGEHAVIMNIREIKPKGLFRAFKDSTFEVTAAVEEKEQFAGVMQNASQETKKLHDMINLAADEKITIPRPEYSQADRLEAVAMQKPQMSAQETEEKKLEERLDDLSDRLAKT